MRNEEDITTDTIEIHRIIRDYCEQLCANKLDNLEETGKSSEICNLPRLNQEEIENLNGSITDKEIESVIKQQEKPRTRWFPW